MENQPEQSQEAKVPKISVDIRVDALTDVMIKDDKRDLNILVVAIPLSTPKLLALGFLWQVINNLTVFYREAEAAVELRKKKFMPNGVADIAALGKKLLKQ